MIKGGLALNQEDLSSFCSGLGMSILLSVQLYFFCIYALANPDEGDCFANSAGDIALTKKQTKEMTGDFYTMSSLFELWFMGGLTITASALLYYILTFMKFKCCRHAELMTELVRAIGYFAVLGTLVWVVAGGMLRWSLPGKACAGDSV